MNDSPSARSDGDRGSAAVEFALITPVVQVILAMHVRATMTSAAAEGARAGALAGSSVATAQARTREILDEALGDTGVTIAADRSRVDGLPVVRVRVTSTLPLVGLLGPTAMTVEGHALEERP
ncbi:MAG: TadE/TadG family type IV pilus assembly protein [Candidatus Nanopelagicales bacterium]